MCPSIPGWRAPSSHLERPTCPSYPLDGTLRAPHRLPYPRYLPLVLFLPNSFNRLVLGISNRGIVALPTTKAFFLASATIAQQAARSDFCLPLRSALPAIPTSLAISGFGSPTALENAASPRGLLSVLRLSARQGEIRLAAVLGEATAESIIRGSETSCTR